jgi:hypothetical protein
MSSLNTNDISFTNFTISENDGADQMEIKHSGSVVSKFTSAGLSYDNTASGLQATTIQAAIDEEESQIQNSTQSGSSGNLKFVYNWKNTTSGDPTSTKVLLNNSTYSSATAMHISNTEKTNNLNVRNLLLLATGEINIYLQAYNSADKYALFTANGIDSANSNYLIFQNLSYVQGNGSFSDNKKIIVILSRKVGSSIKGVDIPALPTTSGGIFSLRYDVDAGTFSWHNEV